MAIVICQSIYTTCKVQIYKPLPNLNKLNPSTRLKPSCLRILLVFYFALLSGGLYAQPASLINYSIREGLPSNEVYDIFQDKEGFIWFATDNGVVRFDGEEIKLFHTRDGLSDPVIFGFHEDVSGRLWFRSYSGRLSYKDPITNKITPYKFNNKIEPLVERGLLSSLYVDGESIWISNHEKFAQIDSIGTLKSTDVPISSLKYQTIKDGFLLSFSPQDLTVKNIIVDGKKMDVKLSETPIQNNVVSALPFSNKILFSLGYDVVKYEENQITNLYTASAPILNLSRDNDDNIWVGLRNRGAIRFDHNMKDSTVSFLKGKSVSKIFQDKNNNFWFATLENGVYFLPNLRINTIPLPDQSKVRAAITFNDEVVIGDQKGTVHILKRNQIIKLNAPILAFFNYHNKKLWVSTNSEILLLDPNFKIIKKKISTSSKIGFSSDNNFVWAAGAISGKISLDGDMLENHQTGIYRSIYVKDSLILLSGRLGLEVRDKNFKLLTQLKELDNFKINNIIPINDTLTMLSTMGSGVLFLNNKLRIIQQLNLKNNFIADNIYTYATTEKDIWMGTENGLVKLDKESIERGRPNFKQLTKENGMLEDRINYLAATQNEIWAITDNGISIVPKNIDRFSVSNPAFYLKSILVNDSEPAGPLTNLTYLENNIEFRFGFLSFNTSQINVRFRLSENNPWVYTSERTIRFFSLKPGKYLLQIEYSADNKDWNKSIDNIPIQISPPWWNVWYIQATIVISILSLILIYFTLRLKYERQRQSHLKILAKHQQALTQKEFESIEKERNRMAKDLHDGIGGSLVTLKMIVSQSIEKTNSQRNFIEEQFQEALSELKNVIFDLSPPGLDRYGLMAALHVYVNKLQSALPIKIELYTFGEEINNSKVGPLLFRVIQELLTNSLKHSKATLIKIQLNSFEDLINVIFEDNGNGFQNKNHEGTGLNGIKFRIENLNGTFDIQSFSQGISFIIDIPLK
jgi:signal transduction histidine kinase